MKEPNFLVEFTEEDFKELNDELQERMAKRLSIEVKDVKKTVLPKKAVTTKVKETVSKTLSGVKPKAVAPVVEEPIVEEPVAEEPSEEVSNDE